jgi:hypothetical protein
MSQDLTTIDDAALDYWRGIVADRAQQVLAKGVTKARALEVTQPEKAAMALYLLNEFPDMSRREVARRANVARIDLDRLAYHNAMKLEDARPELAAKFTKNASELADLVGRKISRINEDDDQLDATSLKDLTIAMGISAQNAATMAGVPTTVIEHRSGPTLEDAMKFRDEVRARLANKAKEESIDV